MAKARRQADPTVTTAADRSPRSRPDQLATITDADITRRAYELYLARGCADGHDVEDWVQAKRELHDATRAAVA